MNRMIAAAAMMAAVAVAPVAADEVDCPEIPATGTFPDGTLCRSVPEALDQAGIARESAIEISSNALTILPSAMEGDTADVTFTFIRDDGAFQFCFGFCDERDIDADILARINALEATQDDKFAFAEQCILGANSNKVFEDMGAVDPATVAPKVIADVPVPANPVFFLLPNNLGADFDAGIDGDRRAWWNANTDKPLFSLSGANPGNFDQLVLFTDGTNTAFMWEDVTRNGGSAVGDADLDFGDLVFSLDAVLDETVVSDCPEGCSSTTVAYEAGITATASSEGNCACLDFTC